MKDILERLRKMCGGKEVVEKETDELGADAKSLAKKPALLAKRQAIDIRTENAEDLQKKLTRIANYKT